MPSRQSKDIQAQTKNVVFNVYSYFKRLSKDSSHPEVATYFIQAQRKTAEACGISLKTIQRITAEGAKAPPGSESVPCFSSPRKTYKRTKYATEIDDYDKDVLRRTVLEFYDRGEFPESEKILSKFKEKTDYKGSKRSMWRILKSINFSYRSCNGSRRFIIEQNDTIVMRVQFLKKMVNFRQNDDVRQVVYLDELEVPTGKRERLIICHAGSSLYGLVKSPKVVFRCKSDSYEDYHTRMNSVLITDWFVQILHNLKEPSIVVMDHAWYDWVHSINYPEKNESKINIQKWLKEMGVEFSPLETLQQLRERVKQLRLGEKKNKLNEIASAMGHEVVQLPQYHYQYNPVKLIRTRIKEKFVKQNTTLKVEDVEKSVKEALDSVTIDEWKSCVTLSHKLQEEDYVKEGLRDELLKSLVRTTNLDDSNETDQSDN